MNNKALILGIDFSSDFSQLAFLNDAGEPESISVGQDKHFLVPTVMFFNDELKEWFNKSGLPIKRFFNTSGLLYKEMKLKDKLPTMSEDEQLQLLATNGMLMKRPLIVGENIVLTGFKENEWSEAIK